MSGSCHYHLSQSLTKRRFRYVFCQLEYVRHCSPENIQRALDALPDTLDETYARTLEDIGDQNWERAHRLFQCVYVAARPLHVEELADILAFDFEVESTPTFRSERRSEDPVHAVLSTCSSLLAVVDVDGSRVVQFAHFSVKEYLTSARLAKAKDTITRFHLSMTPAHTIIAQACLGILLHLDENITKNSLKDFPLAEYAAKHWADHARIENVSSKMQDGLKCLFDPRKCHLSVWAWMHDSPRPRDRRERSHPLGVPRATPLHYAALCNMSDIATFLIVERSQDINAQSTIWEETPLQVSSHLGHAEIVRVLLRHGADIEARNNADRSPLDCAALAGHVGLVQVFLEHGADVNAQDNLRCTPLYWASKVGQLAVARILLSHGADVTAQCENNQTPLYQAKDEEVARLLLEHGADPNALDIDNRTPLHGASERGNVGAAWVLLEHGADPNARDAGNATPLHLASGSQYTYYWGYLGLVWLLLQCSADIHARDDEGQTPFMRAKAKGRYEIMQLLLDHGAEDPQGVMTMDGQGDVV